MKKLLLLISITLFIVACDSKSWDGCDNWCDDYSSKNFKSYLHCHNDCMDDAQSTCPYGKLNCGQFFDDICIDDIKICDGICDCNNCFDEKCSN